MADTPHAPGRALALAANPARPESPARYPHLDGMRGLAILFVIAFHTLARINFGQWMRVPLAGWTGVDLFFVLSGFLITGILYDAKGTRGYFRNFYARRALRIVPLYYAFLVFDLVILGRLGLQPPPHARLVSDQSWLWLFGTNLWVIRNGQWWPGHVNGFWSLAVEEQYYLVWPLLVFLLGRRSLLTLCAVLAAAALAVRTGLYVRGHASFVLYTLPFARMDGFALGGLVALALRGPGGEAVVRRWSRPAAAVSLLLLLGLSYAWVRFMLFDDPLTQTLGYTLVAVFFAGLLGASLTAGPAAPVRRVFDVGVLKWMGKYSYAIYVFHGAALGYFQELAVPERLARALKIPLTSRNHLPILFVAAVGFSLAAAFLSWHLYEKHFLKLKRFFPQGASAGVAPRPQTVPETRKAA